MKIVGVVQARIGSKRLLGKALLPLGNKPMTVAVLDRMAMAATMKHVVAAIPETEENNELALVIQAAGYDVVRRSGDVDSDLWQRFGAVLDATGADAIVRVTGDEPLVDPLAIDQVVATWLRDPSVDFVHNCWGTGMRTWPDGSDVELVTAAAFRAEAAAFTVRFTPCRREYSARLVERIGERLGDLDWCVDTEVQYRGAAQVYDRLGATFSTDDVIKTLGRNGMATMGMWGR